MKLHWQILLAIALAFAIGLCLDRHTTVFGAEIYPAFGFLGSLFLQALKMLVVPLVLSSIICGVAGLASNQALGWLGMRTLVLFFCSTLAAVLVGLTLVNSFSPGLINGQPAGDRLNLNTTADVRQQLDKVAEKDGSDIADVFRRMVPTNIVAAASDESQMLGVICFALLFGFFMQKVQGPGRLTLLHFWQAVNDTMMQMTLFVMKFAPLGVFGLITQTVMNTGFKSLSVMAVFFVTVALGLVVHMFITLALSLRLLGKVNPLRHYRAMFPAMLTAFSTASSSAALPINIKCLEENAGVSTQTTSFVLPLGASINMDGTALYECVAVMFIAQAYGLELSLAQQLTIALLSLLTSMGIAGIPAASLVAISVILGTLGLPAEAIGILMVTDRLLDMMRTTVNVFSDSCCAVVAARWQGEDQILTR